MTTSPSELRLQAAIRDYVRECGDGGIAGDWLLISHYIPADAQGDAYIVTGREGLPEHAARGLVDYASAFLPEWFDEINGPQYCECGDCDDDDEIEV